MKLNGNAVGAARGQQDIVETLKQIGFIARLNAIPLISGLMVSRPQALAELVHILGRPIEPKELVAALKAEDIFEGTIDDLVRRRTVERKKLEREAVR